MKEWFIVNDIDQFIDKARIMVYNKFGSWSDEESESDDILAELSESDIDELDSVLSHSEAMNIAHQSLKKQVHKITKETRYVVDEEIFANIIHDLNSRMVSNILNSLVSKGLVESSFDSDANDFIFWIKNENQDKPETD